MTMFYNPLGGKRHAQGIDLLDLHTQVLFCISLGALLAMQFNQEGHMEPQMVVLLSDKMHAIEEQLDSVLFRDKPDSIPF